MFSSSNSFNPFPQLPPCFHLSPPPSFLGHDGQDIFIHHRPDLLSGNSPVTDTISGMAVSNNATTGNQETGTGQNGHHYSPQNEVPKKKDRHSKIYTAQGPRDRRVRLSIEIARNFFDLQDMLGFDKASKTIDWLLTKSKTAIKELNQKKHSLSTGLQGIVSKTKPLMGVAKEKKIKQQNAASFHLLAKRESRARARARARERTREKMCKRRLNDSIELPADSNPLVLNQIEACQRERSHITEGSMVIKSKLKPSSIFSDEQSLSKDVRSHNIPKNWDIVGTITHPSFCAMTSMNLMPEFQICSKPWEVCDKHRQC